MGHTWGSEMIKDINQVNQVGQVVGEGSYSSGLCEDRISELSPEESEITLCKSYFPQL